MGSRFFLAQLLGRVWFVGSPTDHKRDSMKCIVHMLRGAYHGANLLMADMARDESEGNVHAHEDDVSHISLAKSLASLPDEFPIPNERKPLTRMELKRLIEIRMKKRVKEQQMDGKFHDLMAKVIANPRTLQDAYNSIRLNSNIELTSDSDDLCFVSLAEQLSSGVFDIKANISLFSTKSGTKEVLVLPNLKLKIIQEAIRIAIDVVYRPHFSKISHGCRSGRGHHSALRYICKEIRNPDWWFTLNMNKKADSAILNKLISTMEEKIEDTGLYSILRSMFDAQVLNLEFGGFPKGQGLPQEGVLSPILMNIYLDLFDCEFYRMRMRYEGLGQDVDVAQEGERQSNLRRWFRRQLDDDCDVHAEESSGLRLHACRCMDEIFLAVSGSKEIALSLKVDIQNYLTNSLYLDVDAQAEISSFDSPHGVQFLGMVVRASIRESAAVRAVHKLKDKVRLFAAQKQELWDAGTVRIGKKWLAHGLKKTKESEIKHLADSSSILNQISHFRKDGMKTDHWFKFLLKIWMQDVNAKAEDNEKAVLSKYIAEPALPQDLRDSFYNFQKQAQEYITSETATTLALLSSSGINDASSSSSAKNITSKTEVSIYFIKKSLVRYGLVNREGYPRRVSPLILQDDIQIIYWFEGLVRRWLKWYCECDNFGDVKLMIVEHVRNSCIRTLASKHRMQEIEIEKQFESELSCIPSTQEIESDMMAMASKFQLYDGDESLMYGITYSGLCMLSLARISDPLRSCNCYVFGCLATATGIYTLHVKERQKFPGWKTGFLMAIHPSLHRRRIGLCKLHVKDLYLGYISLQCINFGASCR
ncbi:nuclear intron maturase 4, mitochondrial [Magnolia sinica]|uniref:nuclear intron maturase 4, mitochondrial n=1 Tax=Magnolia sinica TaxID=86752 RepID=UPI002659FECB|nr:nuclear intron maturase 4, mitochondrial [Magnolia sinica]